MLLSSVWIILTRRSADEITNITKIIELLQCYWKGYITYTIIEIWTRKLLKCGSRMDKRSRGRRLGRENTLQRTHMSSSEPNTFVSRTTVILTAILLFYSDCYYILKPSGVRVKQINVLTLSTFFFYSLQPFLFSFNRAIVIIIFKNVTYVHWIFFCRMFCLWYGINFLLLLYFPSCL